ncbi:hypothetical protein U1Q18_023006, partial [Sarracenia purpurea var. burkii]
CLPWCFRSPLVPWIFSGSIAMILATSRDFGFSGLLVIDACDCFSPVYLLMR